MSTCLDVYGFFGHESMDNKRGSLIYFFGDERYDSILVLHNGQDDFVLSQVAKHAS